MPRTGITTQLVVETAASLASESGLAHLTLAQVAEKLGIKTPSLYNHVKGLEGLKREMAVTGILQLTDHIKSAAVGKEKDAAIEAGILAYRAFALANPGLYEAIIRVPKHDDAEWQRASSAIVDVFIQIMEPYGFNEEDSIHIIRGLRSMAHGFVSLERAEGFGLNVSTDKSFLTMLRVYLKGMSLKK